MAEQVVKSSFRACAAYNAREPGETSLEEGETVDMVETDGHTALIKKRGTASAAVCMLYVCVCVCV
jgi:hypothetical protein